MATILKFHLLHWWLQWNHFGASLQLQISGNYTIMSDLSLSPHVAPHVCNKARKLVGLIIIQALLQTYDSSTLLKLYLSYVRPHLEYLFGIHHWKVKLTFLKNMLSSAQSPGRWIMLTSLLPHQPSFQNRSVILPILDIFIKLLMDTDLTVPKFHSYLLSPTLFNT